MCQKNIFFCKIFAGHRRKQNAGVVERNADNRKRYDTILTVKWDAQPLAQPGRWAEADPVEHVRRHKELGCNAIVTLAVSCNGYAWVFGIENYHYLCTEN
jgi:hypothetical protein